MVDPVGATIGALSLAGLVTVCLDCFDFIRTAQSVGRDFVLLEGQLSGLRIRLFAWSKACGFMDPEGHDRRIDHPNWKNHIQTQLNGLCALFLDFSKLVERYDISERYEQHWEHPDSPNSRFVREGFRDFLLRMKATKRHAGLRGAFLCGLKDKKEFTEFLAQARECVDALELVTKHFDLFETQRSVVTHEFARISDTAVLEAIAAADSASDMASDAASQRLAEVRTLASGSDEESFFTAPMESETTDIIMESGEASADPSGNVDTEQHVRVMRDPLASQRSEQHVPVTFGVDDRRRKSRWQRISDGDEWNF